MKTAIKLLFALIGIVVILVWNIPIGFECLISTFVAWAIVGNIR